jgi:hypothetical protein
LPEKKSTSLLRDPNVARWYSNMKKGSVISAEINLRALDRFCRQVKMTPEEYTKLPLQRMEEVAQDFVDELESAKKPSGDAMYSPGYTQSLLKMVRNWAEWNRKPLQRKIKISNPNRRPTLADERSPTQDELKKVLYADTTPLRTRACVALVAFSGVRLEVLGDYLGLDGLRISDFPELKIEDGKVVFSKVPTLVVVREELSKARHQYLSFLGEEGCEIVRQYLERRLAEGEKLLPSSGLIATSAEQARKRSKFSVKDPSPLLRTTKLGNEMRIAMRAVGLPWRPYVFRTYFDTALMLAESKGFVSHAYQQFWMGHSGDIEAQYTTNKRRLPSDILEDMRQSYKKCVKLLQTTGSPGSEEDQNVGFRKIVLIGVGFKGEEVEKLDVGNLTDAEFQAMVKEKLLGAMTNNGARQKVVPANEVESYIPQGWEYVASLPNEKAIVKLPF